MPNNQPYSEKELLSRIAEGDEQAFRTLFYTWKDRLFGFVFELTRSQHKAEDIVQEVFTKVWQHRDQLSEVTHFSGWLFRIAQNHAIDQLRRLSRESVFLESLQKREQQLKNPEEAILRKETEKIVQQAIDSLPPRQKEVYLLHAQQGLKHAEIAQLLGLTVSTVQNHMFRALENLRQYLSARLPGDAAWLLLLLFAKNL